MDKRFYKFFLILVLFICSCHSKEGDYEINKVTIQYQIDKIKLPDNNEFFIHTNSIIKKVDGDKLLLFDNTEKKLLLIDTTFNVLHYFDISKYSYLFNGNIQDIEYYHNFYYIIDNSYRIKIYDLLSDNIRLLPDLLEGSIRPFTSNIKIINSDVVVGGLTTIYPNLTSQNNPNIKYDENKKKEYLVGTIIRYNENKIINLLVDEKYMPFKEDIMLGHEKSFVTLKDDTIYVNFLISNYVQVFDTNGNFIKKSEIFIDEKYYVKTEHNESSEGHKVRRFSKIVPVNAQSLESKNDKLYRIEFKGIENNSFLVEYNHELGITKKYELNNLLGNINYNFVIIKNNLFVLAKNDAFLYKIRLKE
jgi:hypothetical protein